tara:strand:- start:1768 stop:2031 length:264 start_codon:yes stop_codon:yes gene_type:complete
MTFKEAKQAANLSGSSWTKRSEITFPLANMTLSGVPGEWVTIAAFHSEAQGVLPAYFKQGYTESTPVEISSKEYAQLVAVYSAQTQK